MANPTDSTVEPHTTAVMEVQPSHDAAAGEHGGSSPVSGAMFFWFLTIFIVAALILKKYAFGPILDSLDAREEEIARSLENADRLERELATLDEKVQSRLDEADAKVRGMIDAGREAAREAGQVIEAKAREEAQILRENAEREIASAQGKAENALRLHSAEAAVAFTVKLLDKELDAQARKDLTDKLIAGM
jgi:F-type H+-transporting ATPase subunit b